MAPLWKLEKMKLKAKLVFAPTPPFTRLTLLKPRKSDLRDLQHAPKMSR